MKSSPLLCLFLLLFSYGLIAQDMPVIVIFTTKNVKYLGNYNKKVKLIPGATLLKTGKLELKPSSNILLYSEGLFVHVSKENGLPLSSYFNLDREILLDFKVEFGKYIEQAVWNTMHSGWKVKHANKLGDAWGAEKTESTGGWGAEKTESTGGWGAEKTESSGGWGAEKTESTGGWGAEKTESSGGWGAENIKSKPSCPGGIYKKGINTLEWKKIKGTKKYTFYIFNTNGKQIYSQEVIKNQFAFDSEKASLKVGEKYFWLAGSNEANPILTTPVSFSIAEPMEYDFVKHEIKNSDIYEKADMTTRDLMLAVNYQLKGFDLEAFSLFRKLLKRDPKNSLVKMMYAKFCTKFGEINEAKKTLAK